MRAERQQLGACLVDVILTVTGPQLLIGCLQGEAVTCVWHGRTQAAAQAMHGTDRVCQNSAAEECLSVLGLSM